MLLTGVMSEVHAAFDPVNDDTDIFLADPNKDSTRPNVLLYIDNTANWNTAFDNEKSALIGVISNLGDEFNVGTMLFPETGSPNDNVDGGNIRFGIRRMLGVNKTAMLNIYGSFDKLADKGNNATTSLGMIEVYRYFAGGKSRASHGKVKSDYSANATHETVTPTDIGEHPLPANPTSSSNYISPIVDGCQKNFLIYISNGPGNENASALATAEAELSSLGYNTSTPIALSPSGQQSNWFDEWAKYMATTDMNGADPGEPHVYTYVVEVDPVTTGQGPDWTALLKSVANQGNGEYFAVSSDSSGAAITDALNKIFNEIQAVNSVFASTTLPVSVNVRGTNLNQVYVGVFRPDAVKSPRWFGNLKMYQLGFDSTTNTLFLADAEGNQAENPSTGFINPDSPSYWTVDEATDFWGYRTVEENGVGGAADYPDGDLVEKGGAAQQQRISFATNQDLRNLYTCTGTCPATPGSLLSATPFTTANTDITNAALNLGTKSVSPLSAAERKTVTSLSDTRDITLTTFLGTDTYTLDNGAAANAKAITSITTSQSNSITGMTNASVQSINSLTHPTSGTATAKRTVTGVISAGHGFTTGDSITIAGAAVTAFNGTFTITVVDPFTFTYYESSVQNEPGSAGGSPTASSLSTTLTVTVPNHGLSSGQAVAIAGVNPTAYNNNYSITLDPSDPTNKFTVTTVSGMPALISFAGATASYQTTTAIVTLSSHGYTDGTYVDIAGAIPTNYNGQYQITVIDANTFSYNLGTSLPNATTPGTAAQGNLEVIATTTSAHGFIAGQTVAVSGAIPNGYNGSVVIISVPNALSFTYDTLTKQPANIGSPVYVTSGSTLLVYGNFGTKLHGFADPGSTVKVIVSGATGPSASSYNTGPAGVNAFFYPNFDPFCCEQWLRYPSVDGNLISNPPTGTPKVKLFTDTAFATIPSHGWGDPGPDALWNTGDDVDNTITFTIEGAADSRYNLANVTGTIIDENTIKYPLSTVATIGPDTSTNIKAYIKTTTAIARVVAHGFTDGSTVDVAGASPAAFNGSKTITVIDDDTFSYTVSPEQGDATGTITAASGTGSSTERDNLINWIRGADNFSDENSDGTGTTPFDVRASIQGDVLHSRPAVINYNRHGAGADTVRGTADDVINNNDVYIFYGSNDAVFRAVKGGFAQSTTGAPLPGQEVWGFLPEEFFPDLLRLRNNEPTISSSNKKDYFADGTIGVYALDANGDNALDPADSSGDKVILYISMRRGGRFVYALDVTDPENPAFLWHKSNADLPELGYSWSAPRVSTIKAQADPVLIFGAGYDPLVEDVTPSSITAVSSAGVTAGAFYTRSMGRGIFVLDAFTGDLLWQAGPAGSDTGDDTYHVVSGMDYAIPSDVVVISDRNSSTDNRMYVGDTGGNMWRVDMDEVDPENWTVTKLASIADTSDIPGGLRKFLFPPDVVHSEQGFDAVLIGSGDREHPFDTDVVNRMYMFKDPGILPEPVRGTDDANGDNATITESGSTSPDPDLPGLFDATSNCIQDATACGTGVTPSDATAALGVSTGWYITLDEGEKVVGNAVTLNRVTFFNTNKPSDGDLTSCESDLGIARQYKIIFEDATSLLDQNLDGIITAEDRYEVHPGGGYLPSPVPVVVEIDGQIHEGVISGVAVDTPPGTELNTRLRKFWFKEME